MPRSIRSLNVSNVRSCRYLSTIFAGCDVKRRDFLKRSTAAVALAGLGAVRATPSLAQAYPTQPIRIISPFAAGGAADVVARITAKYLSDQLGQPVFIDNRSGAGGTLGTDIAARATPDGYTLVMHSISSAVLNKFLYTRTKLDVATMFAPISQIGSALMMLVVERQVTGAEFAGVHRAAESQSWQVPVRIERPRRHHASERRSIRLHVRDRGGPRPVPGRRPGDGGSDR